MLWFRYLKYNEIGLFPVESQFLDFILTTELEFKSLKLSNEPPRRNICNRKPSRHTPAHTSHTLVSQSGLFSDRSALVK